MNSKKKVTSFYSNGLGKENSSMQIELVYDCQMMGLLLLTCLRGCSKCFHGVVHDVMLSERECDTCDKSVTLTSMRMRHYRTEEF
jgi:hypothetical protein